MNNFSPVTFVLLIFLCFLIVCYYHLNWVFWYYYYYGWLVLPHRIVLNVYFRMRCVSYVFSSSYRFYFSLLFAFPLTWHFSVSLPCHLALAAWCNMTTKTKQETYTTPSAIVHILRLELPRLRNEWKESPGGSWKHVGWARAGKIGGRSRLWRARLVIAISIVSVGMVKDELPLATTSQPSCILMPPFSLSVWPTRLLYWFNLLLLLIIYFSSPSIVLLAFGEWSFPRRCCIL